MSDHEPLDFKPTPARVMAAAEEKVSSSTIPGETITMECSGTPWSVRILGRSTGRGTFGPPLLLLGFWEGAQTEGDPGLEAIVVGRCLTTLSDDDLQHAFAGARPWRRLEEPRKRGHRSGGQRRDDAARRRRT
jgi:hypothetical protein